MDAVFRLTDLSQFHPRLEWDAIVVSAAAVLTASPTERPQVDFSIDSVPGFDETTIQLQMDLNGISEVQIEKARRTFEKPRLVEFAAIALAGIGLHLAGGHEIWDVALRGSSADYLVDEAEYLLEVSGRSRKADFQSAWDERWNRLKSRSHRGFFVCVAEFESNAAKLAFEC